jgi:hypothetical protein
MAQRTQTIESIYLKGYLDAEVKIADREAFCTTVRMRFSNFMKTQLQSLDARRHVRMLPMKIQIYIELGFLKPI